MVFFRFSFLLTALKILFNGNLVAPVYESSYSEEKVEIQDLDDPISFIKRTKNITEEVEFKAKGIKY